MQKRIHDLLKLPNKEFEKLSASAKREYYSELRELCCVDDNSLKKINNYQRLFYRVGPHLRSFWMNINIADYIPQEGAILMCNHSNSHDVVLANEVLTGMDKPASIFLSKEGLSPLIVKLFKKAGSTIIDRSDRDSALEGIVDMSQKIYNGRLGVVFGESTWNLHPTKPMLDLRIGGAKMAAIAGRPLVPTIFEYIETDGIVSNEKDLYDLCVVRFGKPIKIYEEESLVDQTIEIQKEMEKTRISLWHGERKLEDIDPNVYYNHTWLKKYGPPGVYYDTERESKYLFSKNGESVENEYTLNSDGKLEPGIILKKS